MNSATEPELEAVEKARLDRFIQAVGCASVGSLEEAIGMAGAVREDRFGVAEESLAIFLDELRTAREERAAAMRALSQSRRELEEKLSIIERQQAAIRVLSAPMLEVWDRIVTLPLVGVLDGGRIADVNARLLERISAHGDRCVIVDLTGAEGMDTETASHLIKLIRSAELLGAFCVITGLRPTLAATLVDLGVDLGRIATLRTLREGLQVCLSELR